MLIGLSTTGRYTAATITGLDGATDFLSELERTEILCETIF